MKFSVFILFTLLLGCYKKYEIVDLPIPPPPPPPRILPPSSPPNFLPSLSEVSDIQINPIPHPFNLNGLYPYAVWVDGKRLRLNRNELNNLVVYLDLKFSQPKDTEKIHKGEGWVYPLKIKKEETKSKDISEKAFGNEKKQ